MTTKSLRSSRGRLSLLAPLLFFTFCAAGSAASPPSLVVVLVAEQFRSDYLHLYRSGFSAGGFQRLLTRGAVFSRCRFDHLTTLAASNVATLATGAYPEVHGIVANRWYDREKAHMVGAAGESSDASGSLSPRYLRSPTLADSLHIASRGASRVVALSGRAAPAVLMAGRSPLACYWLGQDGHFETSSYYAESPSAWVANFNALHGAWRSKGQEWRALEATTSAPPLRVLLGNGPLQAQGFDELYRSSPFAAQQVFEFAKAAIRAEQLGRGRQADMLFLNVSASAHLGLETGAHSPLMRDLVLRTDRLLAGLLDFLEQAIGLEQITLVFVGGHGVPPLPEDVSRRGVAAGRIAGTSVVRTMNAALADRFGPSISVEKFVYPFVYLNQAAHELAPERLRAAIETAGEAASELAGVASYFYPGGTAPPASYREKLRRSWYAPRSGDFVLVYEPYFVEDFGDGRGTASGSLYRYDTDVPLILFGKGFKAGRFQRVVDATSVAPTLAAVLGLAAPAAATGEVLAEALAIPGAVPRPAAAPSQSQ